MCLDSCLPFKCGAGVMSAPGVRVLPLTFKPCWAVPPGASQHSRHGDALTSGPSTPYPGVTTLTFHGFSSRKWEKTCPQAKGHGEIVTLVIRNLSGSLWVPRPGGLSLVTSWCQGEVVKKLYPTPMTIKSCVPVVPIVVNLKEQVNNSPQPHTFRWVANLVPQMPEAVFFPVQFFNMCIRLPFSFIIASRVRHLVIRPSQQGLKVVFQILSKRL